MRMLRGAPHTDAEFKDFSILLVKSTMLSSPLPAKPHRRLIAVAEAGQNNTSTDYRPL
ncbi:hypothetical protein KEJ39_03595 [Candidatus Bathyarchaeota archaeon]|nr:hypothetical protein [Candidatus Bathyarchaeota archaeon]